MKYTYTLLPSEEELIKNVYNQNETAIGAGATTIAAMFSAMTSKFEKKGLVILPLQFPTHDTQHIMETYNLEVERLVITKQMNRKINLHLKPKRELRDISQLLQIMESINTRFRQQFKEIEMEGKSLVPEEQISDLMEKAKEAIEMSEQTCHDNARLRNRVQSLENLLATVDNDAEKSQKRIDVDIRKLREEIKTLKIWNKCLTEDKEELHCEVAKATEELVNFRSKNGKELNEMKEKLQEIKENHPKFYFKWMEETEEEKKEVPLRRSSFSTEGLRNTTTGSHIRMNRMTTHFKDLGRLATHIDQSVEPIASPHINNISEF